ncbi:uncharacterized protein [Choristoneura fumiferana]|uniref:uncharacterized protein n=1 Tax=Choristoneura fumiferana TaxID=7141 RepID=UPI003D1557D2
MWLKILIYCFPWMIPIAVVQCHLPDYVSTPSNKVEQFCVLAEKCIHDTIPICGRSGEEMRTFLDLCDLLEYACDSNNVFTHIEDTVGCPIAKPGLKLNDCLLIERSNQK